MAEYNPLREEIEIAHSEVETENLANAIASQQTGSSQNSKYKNNSSSTSSIASIKRFKQSTLNLFKQCAGIPTNSDVSTSTNCNTNDGGINEKNTSTTEKNVNEGFNCGLTILDGKYFEIISISNEATQPTLSKKRNKKTTSKTTECSVTNVTAVCCACKEHVNGKIDSSSNFARHLKRHHIGLLKDYEDYKKSKQSKDFVTESSCTK